MKKNLLFFAKCILAALPFLAVIFFTLCFPLCYMDNEYPARLYTHEVIASGKDHDLLILGDSRAMADLMPNEMQEDAVNLATGGATAIENYFYLSDYLKEHEAPKTCILLFAPFHYSYMDNFWQRTVYFNDLSVKELSEVMDAGRRVRSETTEKDGASMELLSDRLRLPHVYLPALINARFTGRLQENRTLLASYEESAGYAAFGTADGSDNLNYEANYDKLPETNDALLIRLYLKKTIELCNENGIDVLLLQAPMNRASFEKLQEGFVKDYALLMQSVSDLYPAVTVEKEIPCYENALFGDSSHLNEKGAKRFTEEIVEKYGL